MDKKKKTISIVLGGILVILVILGTAFLFLHDKKEVVSKDAVKFKEEYEALNGKKAYGDAVYQTLDIDEKNKVVYDDLQGACEFLKNGTGIVYFGFPNCPWCRGILPTLLDVVEDSSLDKLYYVDMTDKRDTFEVEDKKAVKTKDASEEYYDLLEILDEYLDKYIIEEDDKEYDTKEKRIYVPLVVAVKDGKVMDAVTSPVKLDEGQTAFDKLTDKQKEDLKKLFEGMVDKTQDVGVCDEHC